MSRRHSSAFRRRASRFRSDDRGTATVEFVLWMPFFIVLLAIITDFTFIYMTNSSMWDAARDAARAMSVREADATQARARITSKLIRGGNYYMVVDPDSSTVSAIVRISIAEASIFGILAPLMDDDLVAVVKMRKETMD